MSDKNPFNLLPDEIIINIFDKISDAKTLCICTLLSKKLSTLVLQTTTTISVQVPFWIPNPAAAAAAAAIALTPPPPPPPPPRPLFAKMILSLVISVVSPRWVLKKPNQSDITSNFIRIINCLKKFSSIESLTIHLSFCHNPSSNLEPLIRWKIEKSQFILLSAKSVCVYSSENDNDDVLVEPITDFKVLICYHLLDAVWRYKKILKPILCDFPNLKNILVIDSMNQGRIVLDEDDIASLRNEEESLMKDDDDDVNFCLKLWHENLVHLPLSGRVMKGVDVLMCKKIGTNDGLMICENGFEEEEFCELATTMVKKAARFERVDSFTELRSLAAKLIEEEE